MQPVRNGKRVAVVGSGPAGLTVANRLNRWGYKVTVFEKNELVGSEVSAKEIATTFDAVCVAIGAEVPRDLPIEGRSLKGVHFALELLAQQNRLLEGIAIPPKSIINCKGKKVLVIGGGDTGSDCVGTANRHGAVSVTQIEIMPQPPVSHNPATPWPMYPQVLKTSSSHEEEVIEADLVFLAMGFVHPEQEGLVKELSLAVDARKNIVVDPVTNRIAGTNIFASGDAVSGASLVVHAMASGRKAAEAIDRYLSGLA